MKDVIKRILDIREFMIVVIIVLGAAALSFASPVFFTSANLLAVLLGLSFNVIIAVGMTILLVGGGFDMSVGAVLAICGSVTGTLVLAGFPIWLCVILGILLGMLIGCMNGVVIAKIGVNPFITTLGTQMLFRGILQVITDGKNVTGFPQAFKDLGQAKLMGIQLPIIMALVVMILGDIFLRNSKFLRQYYYVGGNEKAAELSGMNITFLKIFAYTLSGALAAFAGIIMTSRLASASVTAGGDTAFQVITAVIIGGASLKGGEGSVFGAFLGCLLMALINNALTLLGVNPYWNAIVIGGTLLMAVIIDIVNQSKKERGLA